MLLLYQLAHPPMRGVQYEKMTKEGVEEEKKSSHPHLTRCPITESGSHHFGAAPPPIIIFLVIAYAHTLCSTGDGKLIFQWTPPSHQRCSIETQDDKVWLQSFSKEQSMC